MSSENPSEIMPKKYSLLKMERINPVRNAIAINNKLADTFSVMLFSPNCDIFFTSKVTFALLRECYGSVMELLKDGVNSHWAFVSSQWRKVIKFLNSVYHVIDE